MLEKDILVPVSETAIASSWASVIKQQGTIGSPDLGVEFKLCLQRCVDTPIRAARARMLELCRNLDEVIICGSAREEEVATKFSLKIEVFDRIIANLKATTEHIEVQFKPWVKLALTKEIDKLQQIRDRLNESKNRETLALLIEALELGPAVASSSRASQTRRISRTIK